MKEFNRQNEELLTNAEKFSTLRNDCTEKCTISSILDGAWKDVLFNQFHDILPGSGIRENYIDATEKHKDAEKSGSFVLQKSLATIASTINTSRITKGTPVIVFNPLSWERTDVATVELARRGHEPICYF